MGLFSSSRKGITRDEYKEKLRSDLRGKGFSDSDMNHIDSAVHGYFSKEGERKIVEKDEAKEMVDWFKENKSKHSLSSEQIKTLEEKMKKYL